MQFSDSVIAKNMTMSSRKMSYFIVYGIGPYFTQMTVKEIMEGPSYFTLYLDKAVTAEVQKQMDLLVCCWSEEHNNQKSNI